MPSTSSSAPTRARYVGSVGDVPPIGARTGYAGQRAGWQAGRQADWQASLAIARAQLAALAAAVAQLLDCGQPKREKHD